MEHIYDMIIKENRLCEQFHITVFVNTGEIIMNVKRKLANALLTLCNQKPLESITVTEIAQKADLTRQVFYKYFVDKYELANWIQVDDYFSTLQKNEFIAFLFTFNLA